ESSSIEDEFDASRHGYRKKFGQHRNEVAGIAQVGVALAIFLQNCQRQFGQVVRSDVLHIAPLNADFDWPPGVAIETETSGDTHGFHRQATSSPTVLWR